jgi:flagellar hook-associated protein 3 FlgL
LSSIASLRKSSENTSAAVKAFKIRRDISSTEGYQSNIDHAKSSLTNTESALSHMEELIQTAKDKILEANTGTASTDERKVVATELRSIQDSLLQALNSNASGVYYFGGTNTDTKPFTLSAGGNLMYNGVELSTIIPADKERLTNDSMYVDIGLGANLIPDPSDPTKTIVDPSSVFQYSISGIKIVGSGTTTTANGITVSNNLYDLLGSIADQLDNSLYSYDNIDALYGKLNTASMEIIYNLTEVGAKESYLDFMTDRYETQTLDLDERQVKVEGADPTKTIIQFKTQQVAYEAALQMGTKIIQPSIFDFMS